MKRILSALVVAALATTWFGCQEASETTTPVAQNTTVAAPDETPPADTPSGEEGPSEETSSEFTLVTLNVPNMT